MTSRRRRRISRILYAAAACLSQWGCDSATAVPGARECLPADEIAVQIEQYPSWLSSEQGAVAVTVTVVPQPPVTDIAWQFALDAQGDGDFERVAAAPATTVEYTDPGDYALQVSALSCATGKPLVARSEVRVRWKTLPDPGVSFVPDVRGADLLTNIPITVLFDPSGDLGALPWQLAWTWGDAPDWTTATIRDPTTAEQLFQTWSYAQAGLYEFQARITDADGAVGRYDTTLIATRRTAPIVRLTAGAAWRDQAILAATAAAASVDVTLATTVGQDGLLLYRGPVTGLRMQARLELDPDQVWFADRVAADAARHVVYVSAGGDGVIPVDARDATYPVVIAPPGQILPAVAGGILVGEIELCDAGRTLWFANAGDGIYGAELDDANLSWWRQGKSPVTSPWTPLRYAGFATAPVVRIPATGVADLACPWPNVLVIARQQTIEVYDLDPIQNGSAPLLVTSLTPPAIDGPDPLLGVDVVAVAATTASFHLYVAAGDDGWSRYSVSVTPASASLDRHFFATRKLSSGFSSVSELRDQIVGVRRFQDWLLAAAFNGGTRDSLYVFDLNGWPAQVTRHYAYEGDSKCSAASLSGDAGGDVFADMPGCLNGLHPVRFDVAPALTDTVLVQETGGLRAVALPSAPGSLQAMPQQIRGAAVRGSLLLTAIERDLYAYDLTNVATFAAAGRQPAPVTIVPAAMNMQGLVAPAASTSLAMHDGVAVQWGDWTGGNTFLPRATVAISGGVADLQASAAGNLLAVLSRVDRRVEAYRVAGSQLQLLATSSAAMGGVAGCEQTMVQWRLDGGRLLAERIADSGVTSVLERAAADFVAVACDDTGIDIILAGSDSVAAERYADGQTTPVWRIVLPWPADELIRTAAVRQGDLVALQARTTSGGGLLVYDTSETPRLVASDLQGGAVYAPVLLEPTSLYYGGLVPESGVQVLYLRQIQ